MPLATSLMHVEGPAPSLDRIYFGGDIGAATVLTLAGTSFTGSQGERLHPPTDRHLSIGGLRVVFSGAASLPQLALDDGVRERQRSGLHVPEMALLGQMLGYYAATLDVIASTRLQPELPKVHPQTVGVWRAIFAILRTDGGEKPITYVSPDDIHRYHA